ncbi:MAG TPA: zf-HC2 domain-containing protein [Ktedonobacteraceae bacterium]
MAQHSNEHLTITELSAYLDNELTPEELALCSAHIQGCQSCQTALADLRLTSALLASMPQAAVPRSFVLPANVAVLPETPATLTKIPRRPSAQASLIWQRSLRAVSTLAAVLGLLIFLVGALSVLPHVESTASSGTTAASRSEPAQNPSAPTQQASVPTRANEQTPAQELSPHVSATREATATSISVLTPAPTSVDNGARHTSTSQAAPSIPTLPATLDLSQPAGRLTIGGILLLLGILGLLITRLLARASRR